MLNIEHLIPKFTKKMKAFGQSEGAVQAFTLLFKDCVAAKKTTLDWEHITPLKPTDEILYQDLVNACQHKNVSKKSTRTEQIPTTKKPSDTDSFSSIYASIAVLKLNGGLGTSMGCKGPKSLIEVFEGQTFLDITIDQIEQIKHQSGINIPFLLLNSFNTETETQTFLSDKPIDYTSIMQHQFPKINASNFEPFEHKNKQKEWNPPGHGDVYLSLVESGILTNLLDRGVEYLFISNADNLGATIDPFIPTYMKNNNIDFLMETTPKTLLDVKGGTLVRYHNTLTLLERSQVEAAHIPEFEDVSTFKIFNTNSIWISIKKIIEIVSGNQYRLPLIANHKTVDGQPVIQLETAMGAAVNLFENPMTCVVPRTRFLPVKKTSDLMLLQSDFIQKNEHAFCFAPEVDITNLPKISFGPSLESVDDYHQKIKSPPSLKGVKSLYLNGNIEIRSGVVFKGDVYIDKPGTTQTILENCELNSYNSDSSSV